MLDRIEEVLGREHPDAVVIFGDTNSTLAGALAAAKGRVPVAHIEAGLRSFVREMPEEVNRVVADSVATWLFAPTETAIHHLRAEGVNIGLVDAPVPVVGVQPGTAYLVGDIMLDALLENVEIAERHSSVLARFGLAPAEYALATVHRASNTDDVSKLGEIFDALALLREPVVVPLHPRTKAALMGTDIEIEPPIRVIEPVGYLDMLQLQRNARVVLTDSGGVQKEAYLLGAMCVTLRDETEWPETLADGWNVLSGTDCEAILRAARRPRPSGKPPQVFGDGRTAERIVTVLERSLSG
jgi:UDP-N-acetylglucosamine 2-epimerase